MQHRRVSLCIFDIDLFKEINDRFGHDAGDEFCFVLPNVDPERFLAERIRDRLGTMAFGVNGSGTPFTASATFGDRGMAAQPAGRNRVCVDA
jgi:GGDEF domain-containing protein